MYFIGTICTGIEELINITWVMKPDIERSFIAVQDTEKLGINASVSIVVMLM